MPKLWTETIDAHRHAVHNAIIETTWKLVAQHGVFSVSMTRVAEETGIGRATLYKYFPDVESILLAYHGQHVADHLRMLQEVAGRPGSPGERLAAVLREFARICYFRGQHGDQALTSLLHRGQNVVEAEQQLQGLLRDLITEAAGDGEVRQDASADDLTSYCLHALTAAGSLGSEAAAERLADITLRGLRP